MQGIVLSQPKMASNHQFDRIGDNLSIEQRGFYPLRSQTDVIGNDNDIKFNGCASGGTATDPYLLSRLTEMKIAGITFDQVLSTATRGRDGSSLSRPTAFSIAQVSACPGPSVKSRLLCFRGHVMNGSPPEKIHPSNEWVLASVALLYPANEAPVRKNNVATIS